MKNFVQSGDVVTATAPTGGVDSGDGVLIGGLFGVAATSADQGDDFEMKLVGVYDLPKANADAFTFGQSAYWDDDQKKVVNEQGTADNKWIGAAVAAAGGSATTVRVRLDGVSFETE